MGENNEEDGDKSNATTKKENNASKSCHLPESYKCANCCSILLTKSVNGTTLSSELNKSMLVRTKMLQVSSRFSSASSSPGNCPSSNRNSTKTQEISTFDILTKFYGYDFELCQRGRGHEDGGIVSDISPNQKQLLGKRNIPLCLLCSSILHDLYRSFLEFNELQSNKSLLSKVRKNECRSCETCKAGTSKNDDGGETDVPILSSKSTTSTSTSTIAVTPCKVIINNGDRKKFSVDEHEFILPHPIDSVMYGQKSISQHSSTGEEEHNVSIEQSFRNDSFEYEPDLTEPEEILGIDENDVAYPLSPTVGVEVGVDCNSNSQSHAGEIQDNSNYSIPSPSEHEIETPMSIVSNTFIVAEPATNSTPTLSLISNGGTISHSHCHLGNEEVQPALESVEIDTSDDQEPPILEPQVDLQKEMKNHRVTGSFICDHCERICENPETLQKHILKFHIGVFKCSTCGKQFSTKENLQFHKSHVHTHSKIYGCELCKYTSHVKRYVVKHMTRKHKLSVANQPSVVRKSRHD